MDLTELIESIDLVEYIGQYVDEFEERGGELWCRSPFTDEATPSFSIRESEQVWKDFSSGLGGSVFTFCQYYHKLSKADTVKELQKYAGIDNLDSTTAHSERTTSAAMVAKKFAPKKQQKTTGTNTILPASYMDRFEDRPDKLEVWRKEGITDEAMRFFGVKYDGFSNCIVYPVIDNDGNIINVGGRTLDPDYKAKGLRKYTYFRGFPGGLNLIFGMYQNRDAIRDKNCIILFEGVKSVMLARGFGIENTGAILTSHLNPSQFKLLARQGVPVVFALDKDVDVTKDHNINRLKQYVNVSYLYDFKNLTGAKDAPVDKGEAVFKQLYAECRRKL